MPTYEYLCKNCGHELEELQSMTEAPLVTCPKCETESLARVMGSGSGLIFKGNGFYKTDYKANGGSRPKSDVKSDAACASCPAASESTSSPPDGCPAASS